MDQFEEALENQVPNDTITDIINRISHYDIYDFISRTAGLNLMSQNQNKSVITDTLLQHILSRSNEEYSSLIIMSDKKFRSIIEELNNTSLSYSVDPCENVFVQNVMFAGSNFRVFNGIDVTPAYNLQALIRVLFGYNNDFPPEYLEKVHRLFALILGISEEIAGKAKTRLDTARYSEGQKVIIPSGKIVKEYAKYTNLSLHSIEKHISGFFSIDELLTDFGDPNTGDIDNRPFYTKPFLKDRKNGTIIVLNISILPTFSFYKAIEWAEQYKIKEKLLRRYNDYLFLESKKTLKKLGHRKINEKAYGLDCVSNDYYKESLFSVFNNQLMYVCYICDDGDGYSGSQLHKKYPDNRHIELLEKRLDYFSENLEKLEATKYDMYSLIILSSFGRLLVISSNNPFGYRSIILYPFELHCIGINEHHNNGFLPRYIRAKNKMNVSTSSLFSELNSVCFYTSNHNTFYISDDIDTDAARVIIAPGDSVEYITGALQKEDRILIDSYDDGNQMEVILFDKCRSIYIEDQLFPARHLALCVLYNNIKIWIKTEEVSDPTQFDLLYSIIDAISYWLSECKEIIEIYDFPYSVFTLHLSLSGEIKSYYYAQEKVILFENCIDQLIKRNHIFLVFKPEAYRNFNQTNNDQEKEFCNFILDIFDNIAFENKNYSEQLDLVFSNPLRKKFYSFNYEKKPFFKPITLGSHHMVHGEDEDYILGIVGEELLKTGEWSVGVVSDSQRSKVAIDVVAWLYNSLVAMVCEFEPNNMLEIIYLDLEITLYKLMLAESRYYSDIACYPERKDQYLENYNNLHKTSMALKFLAEYVTARPSSGTKHFGIGQYEELLAICAMIIDWAYKGDLFYYGIVNTPVEFLKSKRIGMKHNEFADMYQYIGTYRERQLKYDSSSSIRKEYLMDMPDYADNLEKAFRCEFGYSYSDFIRVIVTMVSLNKKEIMTISRGAIVENLLDLDEHVSEELIYKVLGDITYTPRKDFLILPKGFDKEDAYPWRFNRRYSFNRRPVLQRGDTLIWGNRQLYHMTEYVTDLIYTGRFRSTSKEMKDLCGRIAKSRGAAFNKSIVKMIEDMNAFLVFSNVKKINGKRISENGNDLGDIDILIIDIRSRKIIVTETKNFRFSRNPREISQEYEKMFLDKDKPCFATKHLKRKQWVEDHLLDVKEEFKLDDSLWTIASLFIVNRPLISQHIFKQGIRCISKAELSIESIRNV